MKKYVLGLSFALIFIIITTFSKKCNKHLYKVHTEEQYLNIPIVDSTVVSTRLLMFIDSSAKSLNPNYKISDSINGVKLNSIERVIFFNESPEEYYHIVVKGLPCIVLGIKRKSDTSEWVYDKKELLNSDEPRIIKRMKNFIKESKLGTVSK